MNRLCKVSIRIGDVFKKSEVHLAEWKLCKNIVDCLPMGKTTAVDCSSTVSGRYVSVNLMMHLRKKDFANDLLTICELEVFEGKFLIIAPFHTSAIYFSCFCWCLQFSVSSFQFFVNLHCAFSLRKTSLQCVVVSVNGFQFNWFSETIF